MQKQFQVVHRWQMWFFVWARSSPLKCKALPVPWRPFQLHNFFLKNYSLKPVVTSSCHRARWISQCSLRLRVTQAPRYAGLQNLGTKARQRTRMLFCRSGCPPIKVIDPPSPRCPACPICRINGASGVPTGELSPPSLSLSISVSAMAVSNDWLVARV